MLLERSITDAERAERERALEFERSRVARDLHDDLGSSLTEIRVMASTGLHAQVTESRSSDLFQSISKKAHNLVSALDVIGDGGELAQSSQLFRPLWRIIWRAPASPAGSDPVTLPAATPGWPRSPRAVPRREGNPA